MEVDLGRDLKDATLASFVWAVWTEVVVLIILALLRPLLTPLLFGIDFTQECMKCAILSGVPVFGLYWINNLCLRLDRRA